MKSHHVLAGMLLMICVSARDNASTASRCGGTENSRAVVRDFYQLALIDRHPAEAFSRYMSADFLDHKADLAQPTRDGISTYLEGMIRTLPEARWEIIRIVADGDMVSLHARFTPSPNAPPYAIADFFRLKGCKIVEHWDVVAPPPEKQRNPNSRF